MKKTKAAGICLRLFAWGLRGVEDRWSVNKHSIQLVCILINDLFWGIKSDERHSQGVEIFVRQGNAGETAK
ncbi:MAG: hypothetical protein Q4C06_05690 [Bacillota bacterium]|nr:hypothetical protein [Bacillota bacterium]